MIALIRPHDFDNHLRGAQHCGDFRISSCANDGGFTLIELLVVMIIMSILMAAAIPMYTGHKDKARVSNTKVHMRYVMNYLEDCAAGNMGSYRLCSVQALKDSDPGLYKDLMRDNGRMWFCDKTNNLGDLSTPQFPGESDTSYAGIQPTRMADGAPLMTHCLPSPDNNLNFHAPTIDNPNQVAWQVINGEYWLSVNTPPVSADGQKGVVTFYIHHDGKGEKRGCRVSRNWNEGPNGKTTGAPAFTVLKHYCPEHAAEMEKNYG